MRKIHAAMLDPVALFRSFCIIKSVKCSHKVARYAPDTLKGNPSADDRAVCSIGGNRKLHESSPLSKVFFHFILHAAWMQSPVEQEDHLFI